MKISTLVIVGIIKRLTFSFTNYFISNFFLNYWQNSFRLCKNKDKICTQQYTNPEQAEVYRFSIISSRYGNHLPYPSHHRTCSFPTFGSSVTFISITYSLTYILGLFKRHILQYSAVPLPCIASFLAPRIQPIEQSTFDCRFKLVQTSYVIRYPIIMIVTCQCKIYLFYYFLQRKMPVLLSPLTQLF